MSTQKQMDKESLEMRQLNAFPELVAVLESLVNTQTNAYKFDSAECLLCGLLESDGHFDDCAIWKAESLLSRIQEQIKEAEHDPTK